MTQHSAPRSDPLSDFLRVADAQLTVAGGFSAGGDWSLRFPPPQHLKFFALIKGSCWLQIEGDEEPVWIKQGDVFILCSRRAFVLASDLSLKPLEAMDVFSGGENERTAVLGSGEDCIQLGGHVRLDPTSEELAFRLMPAVMQVHAGTQQAERLKWLLDQIVEERNQWRPGVSAVSAQLTQLLFVQTVRAYLESADSVSCGWLRAAGDKRLAPVLGLMHSEPGRAWQLGELARAAGMSRTSFAVHFRTITGIPPLTYLSEWRMLLAQQALRGSDVTLAELASELGYSSESAFSNAFKRITGSAPRHYRNQWRQGGE
ncbi:AraC family transcriptional regulator [Pseudomonas nitroreducens]|uniref:AraC family transcriptional regulator n=1 Tax=Pseudomonas nitroreducens TaxID=46680 RepID=UPI0020A08BD3|nr:AraC family transcriptional regulator [Pseudomonas nitroreducens]MCP1625996.1 AraC-like DNA-binding protein [Pseudomonas nitroreducens]